MIITTTQRQKVGTINVTNTITVKVQRLESVDTALDIMRRIEERWIKTNAWTIPTEENDS